MSRRYFKKRQIELDVKNAMYLVGTAVKGVPNLLERKFVYAFLRQTFNMGTLTHAGPNDTMADNKSC